jgi:hypothetical protein
MAAQSVQADDVQQQIDQLRDHLNSVQDETARMREDLDVLRTQAGESWLTAARADEIRSLVHEVLIDADSRNNLVGDGLLGGWSDGFFLASADGRFKLEIGGLLQERFLGGRLRRGATPIDDEWRYGFENTRMRLNLGGWLFDRDTTFLIQPGWGWSDPHAIVDSASTTTLTDMESRLWDAWVRRRLSEQWAVRMGIFQLPFTRESLISDTRQLAVDRSLIDYRLGLGRSQGIELTWMPSDAVRIIMAVSDGSLTRAGLITTPSGGLPPTIPPWSGLVFDAEWALTVRGEWLLGGDWAQFQEFTSPPGSDTGVLLGLAVHGQHEERRGIGNPKTDSWGFTGDLSVALDGISFFASGTYHHQKGYSTPVGNINTVEWLGWVFQGSTYLTDDTEWFMRWEGGGPKATQLGGADVNIVTTGMNWYLEQQSLKVTSDFGFSMGKVPDSMQNLMVGWRTSGTRDGEWLFRTQLQLEF